MWPELKRGLRSPRLIVAELAVLSAALLLTTALPQRWDGESWGRFAQEAPRLASLSAFLGLDAINKSPWFLAVVLLAGCSLGVVLVEQWRRLLRQWNERLSPTHFNSAPYRVEFERAVSPAGPTPACSIRTTGRLGLLGSPLFHAGLMLILVSGALRLLFFQQALVTLLEGEVLAPEPGAYAAQDGSWLSKPFALPGPMRLVKLLPENYPSGDLRGLAAEVEFLGPGAPRRERLAINAPLSMGPDTLYVDQRFGPAALCEWGAGGRVERRAALLKAVESEPPEARVAREVLPGDFEVRLRGYSTRDVPDPDRLEVRILMGGALLFSGDLRPGQGARLEGGESLALSAITGWAEFRGTRDYSIWTAYLGFLLAGLGALLMFSVIKVDEAVTVTPSESGERVTVSLRAARFAPLFEERFRRLVERERGGPMVQ